jgi:hypothetical protein
MQYKNKLFYQKNKEVKFNFSAEEISSDGGLFLAKKIERKKKTIKMFSSILKDTRHKGYTAHSLEKLISQRVYTMIQGYSDCNDSEYLSEDPIIRTILEGDLASQPTLSRFENSVRIAEIWKLSEHMVESYIKTIDRKRSQLVIDVDGTDDPAHGNQQLSMFNGYYEQNMYHILIFNDGQTGQIILPVLRPGKCHSNKWFVPLLSRIVEKIQSRRPDIKIIIRGDCGFSGSSFYELADAKGLEFCIGITTNNRLKEHTSLLEARVSGQYLINRLKYQAFTEGFNYQAESWHKPQTCYAKVESTGKGMNIRYICSNMKAESPESLYKEFYVQRGEASENRIKEFKNMCYADRLSCHRFSANYFRLLLSALCYEFFYQIKQLIAKSHNEEAKRWQIDNIRLYLMKVGATIEEKAKQIILKLSKSYICRDLFKELVELCT